MRDKKGATMAVKQVTTAGRSLVFSDGVPQSQIDAYANTLIKAQMDTNEVDNDPTTAKHFDTLIANLGSLGWEVMKLGDYSYKPGTGKIRPIYIFADAILAYVKKFLPFIPDSALSPSNYLPSVIAALQHPPPALEKALEDWWGDTKVSGSIHLAMMGPLSSLLGSPFVMLTYYAMTFEASSWHAVLDEYFAEDIQLRSISMTMLLNMITYSIEKDKIFSDIKYRTEHHINTTALDF